MRKLLCLAAITAASQVVAQESRFAADLQKTLEMPGHRSLQSVIEKPETTLSEFETDGCSGGMSSGWQLVADLFPAFAEAQGGEPPWEECCVIHDRAYHNAGGATDAEASFAARLEADEALRQCVANPPPDDIAAAMTRYEAEETQVLLAYDLIASAMFNAVRFGGGPCSGLPWRWGFGYPGCLPGF